MVKKFVFGQPVYTGAVVEDISEEKSQTLSFGKVESAFPFKWNLSLEKNDIIYGLGESVRGMNKRGFKYVSWCSDVPNQHDNTPSMYGAHNFLLVFAKDIFGIFFDTPSRITFDIGWTDYDQLTVTTEDTGLEVYILTPEKNAVTSAEKLSDVTAQFRKLIGQSYIPPFWAFGYQQSRWGYRNEKDVREVVKKYRDLNLPLDSVCLDIDYMEEYEDFTVDKKKFPDFAKLNSDMAKEGIHLVPIIDAGVKVKEGYSVYEEGMKNKFFVTKADGKEFAAGVWPGRSHFTDFFNDDARAWFGEKYRILTDQGVEGFWNDMNEPAMFYSDESLKDVFEKIKSYEGKNLDIDNFFEFTSLAGSTFNREDDYARFFHKLPHNPDKGSGSEEKICHSKIHNIYGAWMTRAAGEGLKKISPEKRMLIYSRASCIGAHRYGGIWQGDNASTWAHLLLEIKMMPGLNMCGFLYNGADIGGFGDSSTRDLVMRWLALGAFTPLMRNHAAWNTREQECYSFKNPEDFKSILDLRYVLLPYIYSEFVKCAVDSKMFMRPLTFDFADDTRVLCIEDQLLVGEGIMIAPVYTQNARGRMVYLPEDMTMVRWENSKATCTPVKKGDLYIEVPEESVVFFVRKGKAVPLAIPVNGNRSPLSTKDISTENLILVGDGKSYSLYEDDGYTRKIDLASGMRNIEK